MSFCWFCHVPTQFIVLTQPGNSVGRASVSGTGGGGFKPQPGHTKVFKNGTSCSLLGVQNYGVELGLVDPVSV